MMKGEVCKCEEFRDRRLPSFCMDNFIRRLILPPERFVSQFVSEGKVVADLGCGPGYFTLPFAKIVSHSGKVYAVDFDAKQIERLFEKAANKGYAETIEAHASSAAEVGFIPDKGVDFVFAGGLLCCMVDHAGAIREIKRILREDGSAYLSISKLARKSDPRAINKSEWRKLISENFKIIREGERLTSRWAHISLTEGDRRGSMISTQREDPVQPSQSACFFP